MNKIEVKVLNESHNNPVGMMMFLAKLTQRGHSISNMDDLVKLYEDSVDKDDYKTAINVAGLPHGTIKRFTPITIAVVGASRRFLGQIRTHHVGLTFVSASLQYSNYSKEARFTVPYSLLEKPTLASRYLESCYNDLEFYEQLISFGIDNDSAGYAMPQGLRNIVIITGNHEAWYNLIRTRSCSRNTVETQYTTMLIWEALLKTTGGNDMFYYAGPDCLYGSCREGKMSCCNPIIETNPTEYIKQKWPLL